MSGTALAAGDLLLALAIGLTGAAHTARVSGTALAAGDPLLALSTGDPLLALAAGDPLLALSAGAAGDPLLALAAGDPLLALAAGAAGEPSAPLSTGLTSAAHTAGDPTASLSTGLTSATHTAGEPTAAPDLANSEIHVAGETERIDVITLFITWTTYGSWLPGDSRGWRKWKKGQQQPQPRLEDWCRDRMTEETVRLNITQRETVEEAIRAHAKIRGWKLHAVSARSNHVHIAVTATGPPKRVRDQFKANGTTALRKLPNAITNKKVWTKGGDIEFIDNDEDLGHVVLYIVEGQDRMDRER